MKMQHATVFLPVVLLALSLFNTSPCQAGVRLEGTIVGITDGDTVKLLTEDDQQVKIRLDGIDAPEKKQAFGDASKKCLSTLIFGKKVSVETKGLDMYKRTLGIIIHDGLNVNLEMVKLGFAWRFDKYSNDQALLDAQNAAKAQSLGLWANPNPVAPWTFRKVEKAKHAKATS